MIACGDVVLSIFLKFITDLHTVTWVIMFLTNVDYVNDNPNVYHQISCNTTKYKNIFFPDSINIWNNLCHNSRSCTSHSTFKNQILDLIRPKHKLTFKIHDRKGLKYIFQLRVALSLLRSQKKRRNFTDTPSDWCECKSAPEKTNQYLFHFSLLHATTIELINSIRLIVNPYNLIDEYTLANNFYKYGTPYFHWSLCGYYSTNFWTYHF